MQQCSVVPLLMTARKVASQAEARVHLSRGGSGLYVLPPSRSADNGPKTYTGKVATEASLAGARD